MIRYHPRYSTCGEGGILFFYDMRDGFVNIGVVFDYFIRIFAPVNIVIKKLLQ